MVWSLQPASTTIISTSDLSLKGDTHAAGGHDTGPKRQKGTRITIELVGERSVEEQQVGTCPS